MKASSLLVPILATFMLAGCVNSYYDGPKSDHFDGEKFFNPGKPRETGFWDFVKWRFTSDQGDWPEIVGNPASDIPPARVDGDELRVSFVGHVTTLIQTQGLNILTDPVWSDRASPFSFIGPKRVAKPGIDFDNLPKIDVVLVSHNHYDHLDRETLHRLWERDRPVIIAPLGNGPIIADGHPDLAVIEKDWGEQIEIGNRLTVHLGPMHHWSARGLGDQNEALWAAFVLETPGGNIYFVGDSGYGGGDYFRQAYEKHGPFRFALLPIGSYKPRWFMNYGHMDPAEAVRAYKDLGEPPSLAIHWGAFPLADDGYDDAPTELIQARQDGGVSEDSFRLLYPGQVWQVD